MRPPAYRLLGLELPTGWRVVEHVQRTLATTGGCFSEAYVVEDRAGRRAFLKALDFSRAFDSPDLTRNLEAMTSAYNFERDLLNQCRERRLDRVVIGIEDGSVSVDPTSQIGNVPYIIFELAEGDIRRYLDESGFDLAWALRALHHMAVGIQQLHGVGIAHQDLKPSNVMVFPKYSKIGDLGRASHRAYSPPHEELSCAGDPSYAPPELIYGHIPTDWNMRRFGCDAYLMGSMMAFFFTGLGMTSMIVGRLDESQSPLAWAGTFHEILPYLRAAYGQALADLRERTPSAVADEVVEIVEQLCDPDPELRGHPRNRQTASDQYSLERYVSRLDLLAKKAEYGVFGSTRAK